MLVEKVRSEYLEARKEKDERKKENLSIIVSSMNNWEKENSKSIDNGTLIKIIEKNIKSIEDVINIVKDKNPDKVQNLKEDVEFLESFLPQKMSNNELEKEIDIIVSDISEENKNMKLMGFVMENLKNKHNGLYDPSEASRIVREKLS